MHVPIEKPKPNPTPIDDPNAARSAIAALNSDNLPTLMRAIGDLGRLKHQPAVKPLLGLLRRTENDTIRLMLSQTLQRIGEGSVPELVSLVEDASAPKWARFWAIKTLGNIGAVTVVPSVVAVLSYRDADLRTIAAETLGKLGSPSAATPLSALLDDEEVGSSKLWTVRVCDEAAVALSKIKSPTANAILQNWRKSKLLPALHHDDSLYRYYAVAALGRLGTAEDVPLLVERLDDTGKGMFLRVCDEAVRALESIGTPDALAAVAAWRDQQA